MTDIAAAAPTKLDIGHVIGSTFRIVGRNLVPFGLLALILSGIPTAVIAYLQAGSLTSSGVPDFNAAYFGSLGWMVLAMIITSSVLQGALVHGTIQDLSGAKASMAECLATGLRAFLPLIGLSILFATALFLGFLMFVVPGVMMLCAWCVVMPSLVADRTGVFGAFSRSAQLTRGHRWRLLALGIVWFVILGVISLVIGAISMPAMFSTAGLDPVAMARSPVRIIAELISGTITTLFTSAGLAVLYVELRRLRDGGGSEWLSEVFS